ncbi:hypothetical protein VYU27_009049 [Nannochloropsis oceanica]
MSASTLLLRRSWARTAACMTNSSTFPRRAWSSSSSSSSSSSYSSSSSTPAAVTAAATAIASLLYLASSEPKSFHSNSSSASFCAPSKSTPQTLYVTGSESGRGFKETVVGVPKEVVFPGPPSPIDSVSFGPAWAAVAKNGNVYLCSGLGEGGPTGGAMVITSTLHEAKGGWFGAAQAVMQVACSRDKIYGRTSKGEILYWTRVPSAANEEKGAGQSAAAVTAAGAAASSQPRFKGPYKYSTWETNSDNNIIGQKRPASVTHVSAGPEHALFVLSNGAVYGVGANPDGRLGLGPQQLHQEEGGEHVRNNNYHRKNFFSSPIAMKPLPQGKRVLSAACGGTHSLLLDEDGGAWSCGADAWYQLAQGETWKVTKDRPEAVFWEPKKIRAFEDVIVGAIAAGENHSLFSVVVEEGGYWLEKGNFGKAAKTPARVVEMWASGFGQYGQLGDRAYVHLSVAKQIKDLRLLTFPEVKLPVPVLGCGSNHSAAVVVEPSVKANSRGGPPSRDVELKYKPQVYVWGHNLGGQCGTGKAGNIAKPVQLAVEVEEGRKQGRMVEGVVCGYDYTGFVVRVDEGGEERGGKGGSK